MIHITQHIHDVRKAALLALLELTASHKFMHYETEFSLNASDIEEARSRELVRAVPFQASPVHEEALFELFETREDNIFVTFAMTDGYVILGLKKDRKDTFEAGKNIYVYRQDDIGHAVRAAVDWLYNPVGIDVQAALDITNGIANGGFPAGSTMPTAEGHGWRPGENLIRSASGPVMG